MNKKEWVTLDAEYVVDSPYLKIRREKVKLPTGEIYDEYYVNERRGWVVIWCQTKDDNIILNKQYKHGARTTVLELPAGSLDDDMTPLECAKKELREETGYEGENWEIIGTFIIDPTYSEGQMYLAACKNAVFVGEKTEDPREDIENVFVKPEETLRLLRDGEINVIGQVAAIFVMLERLGVIS